MNRRRFLEAVLGISAISAVDPEARLWIPGRKKIFIPKVTAPPAAQAWATIMVGGAPYAIPLFRWEQTQSAIHLRQASI